MTLPATIATYREMAYIARAACGCMRMVVVDMPENAKKTAREVAACIRNGYSIEHVTCAYVREHWLSSCGLCKPATEKQKALL